jgi:cysteine desulfurase/selenocysteine lyase
MDAAWIERVRREIVGIDATVPLLGGEVRPYINLDNAATTPALRSVRDAVDTFLEWYSSVHRGTGFKSRLATHWYEEARRTVLRFVGGDPARHVVAFVRNTTEGINLLAHRILTADPQAVVLTSTMEHHSNLLPWRRAGRVMHLDVDEEGAAREDDLDRQLRAAGGRVRLVALSGASNVTGVVPPIHRLAAVAHNHGALFVVDGAQLVAHRRVRMGAADDPGRLDALVFSGHKVYAPYGCGAVVALRTLFEHGAPMLVGGGMIRSVTLEEADWSDPPESDEAGSPNVVGAVALAAALRALSVFTMEAIEAHEADLTRYALRGLTGIPGLTLYGPRDPDRLDRLGVLTFNLEKQPHARVAAILGYEHGIGVRSGCFCAHPLLYHLLHLSDAEVSAYRRKMRSNIHAGVPGAVRASSGIYNTHEDVDALVHALQAVAAGDVAGSYEEDPVSGEFVPAEDRARTTEAFDLDRYLPALPGEIVRSR